MCKLQSKLWTHKPWNKHSRLALLICAAEGEANIRDGFTQDATAATTLGTNYDNADIPWSIHIESSGNLLRSLLAVFDCPACLHVAITARTCCTASPLYCHHLCLQLIFLRVKAINNLFVLCLNSESVFFSTSMRNYATVNAVCIWCTPRGDVCEL